MLIPRAHAPSRQHCYMTCHEHHTRRVHRGPTVALNVNESEQLRIPDILACYIARIAWQVRCQPQACHWMLGKFCAAHNQVRLQYCSVL